MRVLEAYLPYLEERLIHSSGQDRMASGFHRATQALLLVGRAAARDRLVTLVKRSLAIDAHFAPYLLSIIGSAKELRPLLQSELETTIRGFGLEPQSILAAWDQAYHSQEQTASSAKQRTSWFWWNLETLTSLHFMNPLSPASLEQQYGVRTFGRYSASTLGEIAREQYLKSSLTPAVILFPRADFNGAFYKDSVLIDQLSQQMQHRGGTVILEAEDVPEANARLHSVVDRFGPIRFLLVGGHGAKHSLWFGYRQGRHLQEERQRLFADSVDRLGAGLDPNLFGPNPQLVLTSCETGQSGGVAQALSAGIGATVYAPEQPSSLIDLLYNPKKNTCFIAYSRGTTRRYHNGEDITSDGEMDAWVQEPVFFQL